MAGRHGSFGDDLPDGMEEPSAAAAASSAIGGALVRAVRGLTSAMGRVLAAVDRAAIGFDRGTCVGTAEAVRDRLESQTVESLFARVQTTVLARALLDFDAWHKELSGAADEAKLARDQWAELLRKRMVEEGVSTLKIDGKTVSIRSEYWPGLPEVSPLSEDGRTGRDLLTDALSSDPSTASLVRLSFDWQTLRSMMLRDFQRDELGVPIIPEHLAGKMRVVEKYPVRVTRG